MTDRLTPCWRSGPWLLADGATGSNLFDRGLQSGDAPELWNATRPEDIAALERAFIEAGADIILTNTFGGTRYRLKLHQASERVGELNEKAARHRPRGGRSRRAHRCWSAAASGPTGEILEPLGPLSIEAAREAFAEQAAALARGGADILWIETMSSVEETEAAVAGARTTGLPVVATLSFDTNGRTMMGITPSELAGLHRKHRSRGLRQQLRRQPLRAGRLDRQSRGRLRSVRGAGGEGELRHSAIRRRRHPLQRHARADGGVCRPRARCRRADHRRVLRNHARAPARHAPRARGARARARSRSSPSSRRSSARYRPGRPRSCAARWTVSRARPRERAAAARRAGARARE